MNGRIGLGLGLLLGVWTTAATAGEIVWRAVHSRAEATRVAESRSGPPVVSLGQPVPLGVSRTRTAGERVQESSPLATVGFTPAADRPRFVVRAQSGEVPPPAPPPSGPVTPPPGYSPIPPVYPPPGVTPPPPGELYNHGTVVEPVAPGGPTFWDKTKEFFDLQSGPLAGCGGRRPFQSDHAFDMLISPVTVPSRFEDPRSLTELRPVFIYQSIPNQNWAYGGGDIEFFGLQARLALTENWSIVLNKLGGIWINPGDGAFPGFQSGSGFAEVDIGPKWTFLRNERSGTVGAVGLTFEIPTGSSSTYQDTGDLSLAPYLTMAQSFGRTSFGSFNLMGMLGFSFGTNDARTDRFFTNLHLDYDVGNLHRFYPLLELNWTYYASNGTSTAVNFEGRDLINYGATDVSGNNNVSLAGGFRYKFSECVQLGTALEFPVTGRKDLMEFRWTIDMIFRY